MGWEEKKELENIQLDYVRWVLGLDFCTLRYIIYKEIELEKMKIRWGLRAWNFEEKVRDSEESRITKICWMEKQKDLGKGRRERTEFLNNLGYSEELIGMWEMQGRNIEEEIVKRGIDIEKQSRRSKIEEAKCNSKFKDFVREGIPRYLTNEKLGKYRGTIARIRCGNVKRKNKYWLKEEDRKCSLCNQGWGSIEHLLKECRVEDRLARSFTRKVGEGIQ